MIQAQNKYIIIEPLEVAEAGFYMPEDDTTPIQEGVIISVGSRIDDKAVKEGRKIYFRRNATWEIEVGGKKYVYIKYENALAVL
jgi:co-chaperonin GroES (HSP10)